jgi:recombinational DNA repair protein RecR
MTCCQTLHLVFVDAFAAVDMARYVFHCTLWGRLASMFRVPVEHQHCANCVAVSLATRCTVCCCLLQDPQLAAVLLGDDVAAMQDLLRSTYQVGHFF